MFRDKEVNGFLFLVIITCAIAFCQASIVFAKQTNTMLPVAYNNIKIYVNEKVVNTGTVEPFIHNGTVYVPVRAISEALDVDVDWDAENNSVKLKEKDFEPSQTVIYSRENPAPIGKPQSIKVKDSTSEYTATVTLTEVVRGDNALDMLKVADKLVPAAPMGKEYAVAKFKFDISDSKGDKPVQIENYMINSFSGKGTAYAFVSVVVPEPKLSGVVANNDSIEGYAVFLIDKLDDSPKCVFERDYDGTGGIWFSLKK